VIQYCEDYDGRGPTTWWDQVDTNMDGTADTEYMIHWREKLASYGAAFWILPDERYFPSGTMADVNQRLWICKAGAHWSTYNLKWINGGFYLPYPQGWQIDDCKFPSETMLLGECPWENSFYGPPYPAGREPMHNSHMNCHPSAFIGPKEHPWRLGGPSYPMGSYPDSAMQIPDYAAAHLAVNVMAMYDGSARTMKPAQMWGDLLKYKSWWSDESYSH